MVQAQIINKVLETKDYTIIKDNYLDKDYFPGYEKEFEFLKDHYTKYNSIPDKETFLAKFPKFSIISVSEKDEYLVNKIREEKLYADSVPVVKEIANLLKTDANKAIEYMLQSTKTLKPNYSFSGVDIIKQAKDRFDEYKDRQKNQNNYYFKSGFDELDKITNGIQRGEELYVLFARTNQGKSWVAEKIAVSIWSQGYNIGFISPEMTASSVGYRFDTLYKNFSNSSLTWGQSLQNESTYKTYLEGLSKNKNKFLVATPIDFSHRITISKLRNFVIQEKLDALFIDGITYLSDERYKKGDNKTITLTNISEDLMSLSVELKIPIIVVVQANRDATKENDSPELETIRDSDGISHNASKIISIRNKHNILELAVKKQRNGQVGNKVLYGWDIDTGTFIYTPSKDDGLNNSGPVYPDKDEAF